ncbi:MAG TPA: hypothetical protein VN883_16765, partial [Myxococcales bacterium]|nr:hypothetical protein [Myxococcales bacterium]
PEVEKLRAELPSPAEFVVSDSEVEEVHDLPRSVDTPHVPAPGPSVSTNPIVATIKAALAAEAESEGSASTGDASEAPATPADARPDRPRSEEP